jgi:hypothetical protein
MEKDASNNFSIVACVLVAATESLPSNVRGIQIQTHRLMERVYEVRCRDGLRCHDIHVKFNNDWFRHTKVEKGDKQAQRA